jgi:hypothetical protein
VLVEVVQLDPIRIAFALEEGRLPPKPDSMRISAP